MKKYIFSILALGFFVNSCGVAKKDKNKANTTVNTVNSSRDEVVATSKTDEDTIKSRPVYHGSDTKYVDLVHTKLEVKFDWAKSYLYGKAWITAKPHFYQQDSIVLNAKGMDINKVEINNQTLKYKYVDDLLTIYLDKIYKRGENFTVFVDYTSKPEERTTGGSAAIQSDKGLYFINPKGEDADKMPQIWTQGETQSNSVWFPTVDSPDQKMTQEISMTVDDKYTTLSNGLLLKSTKNADGTRTDYWKTELPFAPYLTMLAVGEFKVVKDSYTKKDGSKMQVNYYVEPEWESSARAIFGQTPEMIRYFGDLLGVEYVWSKFDQIIVRDYVSGAMENVGAVLFGDFVYKTARELIDDNDRSTIAHELFHHWFGDLVTTESWSNLPLNESFANYSQYLWDEHAEGQDEAEYKAGIEADGYFQTEEYQGGHNMIWYDYNDKEDMFDGHSYNKGGRILNMLRNVVGDSAFFDALHVYLTDNKFKTGEIAQLRLAFESVTGEDLNWFFNQWFLAKGHPILSIEKTISAGQVAVTINQNQDLAEVPLYRLPMKISVFDKDVRKDYQVVLDKSEQTFTFPIKDSVSAVIVDADHVLLAKWKDDITPEEALYQFYHGGKYMDREIGLAKGVKSKTTGGKQVVLDALNDPFYHIRELAIKQAKRLKRTNKDELIAKLTQLVKTDPVSSVRSSALEFLIDSYGDEPNMKELVTDRLNSDSSYLVIGDALVMLADYDSTTAMNKAKALESEPSQSMLSNIAMLYGKYGNQDQLPFFQKNMPKMGGLNQIQMLLGLATLASRGNVSLQSQSFDLFENAAENGGMYAKIVMPTFLKMVQKGIQENIDKLKASDEKSHQAELDEAEKIQVKYNELADKTANGYQVNLNPDSDE